MNAGLNLFSIRNQVSCEAELFAMVPKLRAMGYSYVQFSGCPYDADMIKRFVSETGLRVVLTHVPYDRIINDTDALVAEHKSFGCTNIGLGMMPMEYLKDDEKCREAIKTLDSAAEHMNSLGCRFFYHHHHFEFMKFADGERIIDYMLRTAKHINFTADTYWLQYGGADILEYLEKMSGRIECVHLKDYAVRADSEGNVAPHFAPVGSGNLDFKAITQKALSCGAKYFLVEQDDATDYPDPEEQIGASMRYIRDML